MSDEAPKGEKPKDLTEIPEFREYQKKQDAKIAELQKALDAKDSRTNDIVDDAGAEKALKAKEAELAAKEKAIADRAKEHAEREVKFHRERISKEFSIDIKDLEQFTDPKDMELYGYKQKESKKSAVDRQPAMTSGATPDALRTGLEKRLSTFLKK